LTLEGPCFWSFFFFFLLCDREFELNLLFPVFLRVSILYNLVHQHPPLPLPLRVSRSDRKVFCTASLPSTCGGVTVIYHNQFALDLAGDLSPAFFLFFIEAASFFSICSAEISSLVTRHWLNVTPPFSPYRVVLRPSSPSISVPPLSRAFRSLLNSQKEIVVLGDSCLV